MKNSGIKWIGEIPEEWEVRKLKYLGDLSANGVDKKIQDGEKLFKSVHYMNVYNNSLSEIKNGDDYLIISANGAKANGCTLERGDVLFTNSSETPEDMGHSAVIYEKLYNTLFGYHLTRFRPKIVIYLQFEKYLFGSYYMRKWFEYRSIGMTRYGISYSDFAEALIILPTLSEQQAIANFLDRKCNLIDNTIEKQKVVIEKLKLYKQSVITEAVTKGLDPTVKMKPSGVEWIGDIPEGWDINKIKFVTSKIGSGKTPKGGSEIYSSTGITFLRSQNIHNDGLRVDDVVFISDEIDEEMSNTRVLGNDILLNITGGSIGRACIYPMTIQKANVNQHVCIIRSIENLVDIKFLYYIIICDIGATAINVYQSGANREGLNFEQIANINIPYPTLNEQIEISEYLEEKCSQIDSVIEQKNKLLEKLTDYKKSLIYECVTGKKEVI